MVEANHDNKDFSRRKFLKGGAILGAAAGLSTVVGGNPTKEVVKAFGKKELDEFPVELNSDFKRYDNKMTVFNRPFWDSTYVAPSRGESQMGTRPGFYQYEKALSRASWSLNNEFAPGSQYGAPSTQAYAWEGRMAETKAEFESKEEATKIIKKAAKYFGADLVGIAKYEDVEKWTYDPLYNAMKKEEIAPDFPFKPKSVIVMAVEMSYDTTKAAPSYLGGAATGLGYSRMVFTANTVTSFIRNMGYKAFGAGNDVSISVPLAIQAGLGELGRNGLLLTQEYGPRVRLCKVYTEMELVYDKPIEFGGMKFCEVCKRCAEACPSQSIPLDTERNYNTLTKSNQAGVKKWYVNVETCANYWRESDTDCSVCIAVCPYNKPNFWHHTITSGLTSTPIKPFLKAMDELFGYGHTFDEQAALDFWE